MQSISHKMYELIFPYNNSKNKFYYYHLNFIEGKENKVQKLKQREVKQPANKFIKIYF